MVSIVGKIPQNGPYREKILSQLKCRKKGPARMHAWKFLTNDS